MTLRRAERVVAAHAWPRRDTARRVCRPHGSGSEGARGKELDGPAGPHAPCGAARRGRSGAGAQESRRGAARRVRQRCHRQRSTEQRSMWRRSIGAPSRDAKERVEVSCPVWKVYRVTVLGRGRHASPPHGFRSSSAGRYKGAPAKGPPAPMLELSGTFGRGAAADGACQKSGSHMTRTAICHLMMPGRTHISRSSTVGFIVVDERRGGLAPSVTVNLEVGASPGRRFYSRVVRGPL